jgi:hypothetical protein
VNLSRLQEENTQADIERALVIKKAKRSAVVLQTQLTVEKDRVYTLQGQLDNTLAEKAVLLQERKKSLGHPHFCSDPSIDPNPRMFCWCCT